jgi:hypothetical protein
MSTRRADSASLRVEASRGEASPDSERMCRGEARRVEGPTRSWRGESDPGLVETSRSIPPNRLASLGETRRFRYVKNNYVCYENAF